MKILFRTFIMILLLLCFVGCTSDVSKESEKDDPKKMHTYTIVFDESNTADLLIFNKDGKKQGSITSYFDGKDAELEITRMIAMETLFYEIEVDTFINSILIGGKDGETVAKTLYEGGEFISAKGTGVYENILNSFYSVVETEHLNNELSFISNQIIKNITDE